MKMFIFPYIAGSESVKNLRFQQDDFRIIRRKGSKFKPRNNKCVINWGSSDCPYPVDLNSPQAVRVAKCKIKTFKAMEGYNNTLRKINANSQFFVRYPEFTEDHATASKWLKDGHLVCSRATTTGHEGAGLVIHDNPNEQLPVVPLYTKYVKKRKEFRVHVVLGEAIDVVEKRKRKGQDNKDYKVRNTANGYVFCRENVVEPEELRNQAIGAVFACQLDFGAVDIVWNEKENKCYVLEVNTAPGITGTTVLKYREAFREHVQSRRNNQLP